MFNFTARTYKVLDVNLLWNFVFRGGLIYDLTRLFIMNFTILFIYYEFWNFKLILCSGLSKHIAKIFCIIILKRMRQGF